MSLAIQPNRTYPGYRFGACRFGYRRVHQLLCREGIKVNHKNVYRLYREAGQVVRKRKRSKGIMLERQPQTCLICPSSYSLKAGVKRVYRELQWQIQG